MRRWIRWVDEWAQHHVTLLGGIAAAVIIATVMIALVMAGDSKPSAPTEDTVAGYSTQPPATATVEEQATSTPRPPEATNIAPPATTDTPSIEDQLRKDCPAAFRDPCVDAMTRVLNIESAPYGRVALCVNARGNWWTAAEKGSPPSESLTANSKVGDPCPGSPGYSIKAIYTPGQNLRAR
jgi:hypothetical protein